MEWGRALLWAGVAGLSLYAISRVMRAPSFPLLPGLAPVAGDDGEQTSMTAPSLVPSVDIDTLARTLYGEARGQGQSGMEAVASVVLNRVDAGTFPGGTSIAGVCRAPRQFSCWNAGDPNLPVIQRATTADRVFAEALAIATEAVNGELPDTVAGATLYHDTSIRTPAAWGNVQQVASIGALRFFA